MKMTFKVIVFGGLAVFFAVVAVAVFTPVALWKPPQTVVAHEYTAEQMRGRELYYSNGCNYCHTQYVREVDNGMGPVSEGGDYTFDNPMILGSERTGPDLSYIGRKRSMSWEIDHLKEPRDFSPMSIMPSFAFLPDEDLRAIGEYLYALGDRNAAEWMVPAPASYAGTSSPSMGESMLPEGENSPAQGWDTFKSSGLYEGKLIYTAKCLTCHGCAGNGLGHYAGTLIVTPANFKVDPFRTMPDDQWFWHVSEGVQGTVMPPWKESLTESQRWNVIHYVQQVYASTWERDPDEGDVPAEYQKTSPLEVTLENIDAGKRLWTRECLVCHGDAATGEGPYRAGIEPVPPDFSSLADYADWGDDAYFWRISEGVPWSAMPAWKVSYNEEERFQLVMYIRTMFTQTLTPPAQPAEAESFDFPKIMHAMAIPTSASYDAGRQMFLERCAHCHGVAGDGTGWAGQYLNPKPADLRKISKRASGDLSTIEGEYQSKLSFGIKDSAMPTWGEFLSQKERWNDVRFVLDSFLTGKKVTTSQHKPGALPTEYVRTDTGIFQGEIATIDPAAGKPIYERYCQPCHAADGKGNGPGTIGSASGSPAAFPSDMEDQYVFYRVRAGVSGSMMYGFEWTLSETDIWNVSAYTIELTGRKFGG
ncbi:MAG: hypothetical protein CVT59_05905 [Actinobacteria bacterium HGW-Actinobacteria-1]|jgi:mono/diheme cytochrome c family protein|nr:MAG: hypothetical protein CVT59_05905 [Actinobacteria bacterium HGW-Actinobacteria-1]